MTALPDAISQHLPTILAITGATVLVALLILVAVLIGYASRRRGAGTLPGAVVSRTDRWIFRAAFIFGAVVYGALILGSFEGLTGFARDILHWTGWQQYLVPVSLDGLGTAAGFLAFRAVKKKTSPYLCYAMVWGATAASAGINFDQGGKHGGTAAFYMAFLSVAVMVMFHLFLGQFQAGAEYMGTKYVRFGIRWVTYFGPTLLDFLCWVNHPPAVGTEPTVANAVEHRQAYRKRKAEVAHVAALVAARRAAELAEAEAATRPEVEAEPEPATEAEARQEVAPEAPPAPERKPDRKSEAEAKPNSTAVKVAAARRKNPGATQKEIAEKVRVSDRTVREYWAATAPTNVTPIHKEAAK